jgi:hypothetical protein
MGIGVGEILRSVGDDARGGHCADGVLAQPDNALVAVASGVLTSGTPPPVLFTVTEGTTVALVASTAGWPVLSDALLLRGREGRCASIIVAKSRDTLMQIRKKVRSAKALLPRCPRFHSAMSVSIIIFSYPYAPIFRTVQGDPHYTR